MHPSRAEGTGMRVPVLLPPILGMFSRVSFLEKQVPFIMKQTWPMRWRAEGSCGDWSRCRPVRCPAWRPDNMRGLQSACPFPRPLCHLCPPRVT